VPLDNAKSQPFDFEAALRACANGDATALQRIYQQESGHLLGVALRLVRQRQVAEDVLHDAFLKIWRRAGTFDPAQGSGRGWIYSIVRNQALNVIRDGARVVSVSEEAMEAIETEAAMQHAAEMAEAFDLRGDLGQLDRCLARLDTAKRNSILYAYVDGCSHGEIAERLQSPLGTVKAWIRRGLSSLRECMA
jgi:RNA polymerase sigma factor (sigma-70 family)